MAILGWKIGLLDVHLLVGYWKMGGWPGGEFALGEFIELNGD